MIPMLYNKLLMQLLGYIWLCGYIDDKYHTSKTMIENKTKQLIRFNL